METQAILSSPNGKPVTEIEAIVVSANGKPVVVPEANNHVPVVSGVVTINGNLGEFTSASFPKGFLFGAASAAYQYEGAAREGGRGISIWDTFTHQYPAKIKDGSNGDVAVDFYRQYKEDVKTIKKIGLKAFRFSISWTRVLPSGRLSGGLNKEGIKFYNDLIDELLANGLTPFVTLFHWDMPQTLEDEYGGFRSGLIVDDFCDYAELCFWEFGDRVKHWITVNEPWTYATYGYATGAFAPGRGASSSEHIKYFHKLSQGPSNIQPPANINGDPGTEPYWVTHNQILAHAAAVKLYRQKYQASQKGQIGITLVSYWMVPYSDSQSDHDATQRALDFMYGWYMEPLTTGEYPRSMRKLVRKRLPEFKEPQSELVKGSYDFIGVNYYTARYVADANPSRREQLSYVTDPNVDYFTERDGVPIGPKGGSDWFYIYPEGFYDLLMYTKNKYKDPVIYITENGIDELDDPKLTLRQARVDPTRKSYLYEHLRYLLDAIHDGVKVKGYFYWSFLDNFEWATGYDSRFGLIHINYRDGNFTRYPKDSAIWFMNFLKRDA